MTFLPLIIFICILILAIWISRNNYKNRKYELINNLKDFNKYIENYYHSMEDYKKEKFNFSFKCKLERKFCQYIRT